MELTVALISVGGVVVSAIISAISSMALVNWRLSTLEKKVDEHNAWGDKFQQQSTDIALIKQSLEFIKENISKSA